MSAESRSRIRISRRTMSVAAFVALLTILGLADLLVPYSARTQHREHPLEGPSTWRWLPEEGFALCQPRNSAESGPQQGTCATWSLLVEGEVVSVLGRWGSSLHLVGSDPGQTVSSPGFVLGTDSLGRDVWSRLVLGGRVSLAVGAGATLLALGLGLLVGTTSAVAGDRVDAVLMRCVDLLLSIPWLLVVVALRAALPLDLRPEVMLVALIVLLGLMGWMRTAQLVRNVVIETLRRPYVDAARSLGASLPHIVRQHLVAPTTHVLRGQALLLLPSFIAAEVTLSFLGLGILDPMPSWGQMLADISVDSLLRHWWLLSPAAALAGVAWLCHLLARRMVRGRVV